MTLLATASLEEFNFGRKGRFFENQKEGKKKMKLSAKMNITQNALHQVPKLVE